MPLTVEYVQSVMGPCGQGIWEPFLSAIAPDVQWWICSEEADDECHSGIYNFEQWKTQVAGPMTARLVGNNQDMLIREVDVVGQKAIIEAEGKGTQINGRPYNNRFCWILIFDDEGKIVKIREYMHSALVKEVMTTNQIP